MDLGMPVLIENKTIAENAKLCAELGLNFLELNMNFPICTLEELSNTDHLLELAENHGIYYTLHLDENLSIADFNSLASDAYLETVKRAIGIAKQLHIPNITMHMNHGIFITLPEEKIYLFDEHTDLYMKKFSEFKAACEQEVGSADICMCIENTDGFTSFERTAIELMLESEAFGLTFDIGHSHAVKDVDEPFILKHASKLRHFHIHDALGKRNHLPLGTGEINLAQRLVLAKEHECRCVLETKTIAALRQSVDFLNKQHNQI